MVLTPPLHEALDGVLLSDGSLHHKAGRRTASLRLMQSAKRKGWLCLLRKELAAEGVAAVIDSVLIRPSKIEERELPGGQYLLLRSMNYVELVYERNRWYPNERKIVPRDLRLTPTVLLHWFCGDGRGGDSKGTLGFCTDGFSVDDVEFLVDRLQTDLDIATTLVFNPRGHPQILVGRRGEAVKIQELLLRTLPICCRYKLQHVRPLPLEGRGRRLSESLKQAVLADRGACSMREAATKHGVSVSKVWKLWTTA
jgi:hypothetical protein